MISLRIGWVVALLAWTSGAFSNFDHEITYHFDESLDGWAPAAASEMQIDVLARGGNLVGIVSNDGVSEPHLDSPPLALDAAGRQTVILRMKYQGGSLRGARLAAQYGTRAKSPDHSADHGRVDWRVRRPPVPITTSGLPSESPINDDDVGTVWKGIVGEGVMFAFQAAGHGSRGLDQKTMAHAVTDLEIRCVAGTGPSQLDLQSSTTRTMDHWTTVFSTTVLNNSDIQRFSTSLSPDEQHAVWRVVFPSSYGSDIRIRELRLLPAVVETRFSISPNADYQAYVVPLWRRAAIAKLGGDEPSSYHSPLLLTRLRLYLGEVLLTPSKNRYYNMATELACEAWRANENHDFDEVPWAAAFWRLRTDSERAVPWVVSELTMHEDSACSAQASLVRHVDENFGDSFAGAIASAWVGAASGLTLRDGECLRGIDHAKDEGEHVFISSAVANGDESAGGTWLGYAFEQSVTVRCVAICQNEDAATQVEFVNLEWSDDGKTWTPHATLSFPSATSVVRVNPCELRHEADDLNRKQREAYGRSAQMFKGSHGIFAARTTRDAFLIDSIVIAYPPLVRSVTGCVDKFWPDQEPRLGAAPFLDDQAAFVPMDDAHYPHYLESHQRDYARLQRRLYNDTAMRAVVYANTFACPVSGGLRLTLKGERLGSSERPTKVLVDGRPCMKILYHPHQTSSNLANSDVISCQLPPGRPSVGGRPVDIAVLRADMPELRESVQYLAYQGPPARVPVPTVLNIAARSVDLTWEPPRIGRARLLGALQTTGYVVTYCTQREAKGRATYHISLGNVTTTTIVGLEPDTRYVFAVAAAVENRFNDQAFVDTVDLYGRRSLLPDAFIGPESQFTNGTTTLTHDVQFDAFSANATLHHGSVDEGQGIGPSGLIGGEGNFGLVFVGSANLENCNTTHACCDGFDFHKYQATGDGCLAKRYACVEMAAQNIHKIKSIRSIRDAGANDPTVLRGNGVEKRIARVSAFTLHNFMLPFKPTASCGPAIRLTSSSPRRTGALWYSRRLNVREGFESTMLLRTSNPSQRCGLMDGVFTSCTSRGGDGFAFVIQEDHRGAVGREASGLGYEGVNNSISIELDMHYNPELIEPYHNHIAVHSRGWRHASSAHHNSTFASSVRLPRATSLLSAKQFRTLRVRYEPVFDPTTMEEAALSATSHIASFFLDGDFGAGLGALSVFVDDLESPLIIAPVNIEALIRLRNGRAWIGITASTGPDSWQTHDVLAWNFTALRRDPETTMFPAVDDGY